MSKLKKKWLRKWSLKLPTPPPKMGRILCSQYTLIDPLSHALGHYGPWTWHIRPRVQNYPYFTFYQCVEQVLLSLQVMKMQRDIKGVHIVSSEFCRFFGGGLATLGFIFSVISSSILKISVRKYPDFCILNKFKCRYGHFNKKQQFFGDLLSYNIFSSFITWIKLPKDLQQYQNSRQINCILKISDIKFSMFIILPSLQFG